MFIDRAKIYVKAGDGGDGIVSFHTAKYVPTGGPDGGNGGRGGDIIFFASNQIRTLKDFRYKRKYLAENGQKGGQGKCSGASGKNLEIPLPVGTIIRDSDSGRVLVDLNEEGMRFVVAKGGYGGKGNAHYKNSVRQAPRFARVGGPGDEKNLEIEIKLLADVGLVGYPNVGKSTLLSVISSARPKIGDYHFTTLSPKLGVVSHKDDQFVVADIPGLIEGASEGAGLGHDFLKHVERTRMLLHLVDASESEGTDSIEAYKAIVNELVSYHPDLAKRKQVLVGSKADLASEEQIKKLKSFAEKEALNFFPVCAPTGQGLEELLDETLHLLQILPESSLPAEDKVEKVYSLEEEKLFEVTAGDDGVYTVSGSWIENLVTTTNFDDHNSLTYFQRLLKRRGIIEALEEAGIKEGDTVVMHTLEFDYIE